MISDGTQRLSRISDGTLDRTGTHRLRTTVLEGYLGHSPDREETERDCLVLDLKPVSLLLQHSKGKPANEPSVCVFACVWSRSLGREEQT